MKTTTLRLRRIRYKDGRVLEVLRPPCGDPRLMVERATGAIRSHFEATRGPHGMSVVCWSSDGYTTASVLNDTNIPGILLPDLVRNVLLGHKIEDWTLDTLRGAP